MKKKMLGGLAILAIAAIAAFNINMNTQEQGLSDISLNNVEALAAEHGGGRVCYNTITTKTDDSTLYCGTCRLVGSSKPGYWSGKGECS